MDELQVFITFVKINIVIAIIFFLFNAIVLTIIASYVRDIKDKIYEKEKKT